MTLTTSVLGIVSHYSTASAEFLIPTQAITCPTSGFVGTLLSEARQTTERLSKIKTLHSNALNFEFKRDVYTAIQEVSLTHALIAD